MLPADIETRRHGDVKLRVDTLVDGTEIFWLQSGVGAIQLKEEHIESAYRLLRPYAGFDVKSDSTAFIIFAAMSYFFLAIALFGG